MSIEFQPKDQPAVTVESWGSVSLLKRPEFYSEVIEPAFGMQEEVIVEKTSVVQSAFETPLSGK